MATEILRVPNGDVLETVVSTLREDKAQDVGRKATESSLGLKTSFVSASRIDNLESSFSGPVVRGDCFEGRDAAYSHRVILIHSSATARRCRWGVSVRFLKTDITELDSKAISQTRGRSHPEFLFWLLLVASSPNAFV